MYKTTPEQNRQKGVYLMAYRAIRAYQSGQSIINPLTALRTMLDILPTAIAGNTVFTINKAQASFNQRYMAPKGVHECAFPYAWTQQVNTPYQASACGCSTLRSVYEDGKIPAWLHQAKLHAASRKVVRGYAYLLNRESTGLKIATCSPIERLMLKADMLRIVNNRAYEQEIANCPLCREGIEHTIHIDDSRWQVEHKLSA